MELRHLKGIAALKKNLTSMAFYIFFLLYILVPSAYPGIEHPMIMPILKDLEDTYQKGGIEAAKSFSEKKGLKIKAGDKITVILVLKPIPLEEGYGMNYNSLFDKSRFYLYGVDDVKSSGNRLLTDLPINMINKLANEIEGIQYITLPDQRIIEKLRDNERFEKEGVGNGGCFEVSRFVIEQRKLTKFGRCMEVEYKIDNERIYFVDISIPTNMDCPEGCITVHFKGIVENGKIIDFQDFDYLKQTVPPSANPICDWGQPYRLSLVKINNQYKWRADFDEIKSFRWKVGFYEYENKYCLLKGYALIGKEDYDLSNLKEQYTNLNCDDQETADAMCLRKQVQGGGTCDNLQSKKNACLYFKANAEKKLEVCNLISNDSELTDMCYYSLALRLKDPNICHIRNWSEWYNNNCEKGIKERGEQSLH